MQAQRVHPCRDHFHGVGLTATLRAGERNRCVTTLGSVKQIQVDNLAHRIVDVDSKRDTHTIAQAVAAQRRVAAKQVSGGDTIQVVYQ